MAEPISPNTPQKEQGIEQTQLTPDDLEALRIEAQRPIKCGGTYTQCQKNYGALAASL